MDVRVGPWRRQSTEELMLLNNSAGEDSWESLGLQGEQTVNPKGNQPWIFTGRPDVEAEAPILWPPHVKSWLTGKASNAGKGGEGQEEKRVIAGCITDSMDMSLRELQEMVRDREARLAAVPGVSKSQTGLGDWITTATNGWFMLMCGRNQHSIVAQLSFN